MYYKSLNDLYQQNGKNRSFIIFCGGKALTSDDSLVYHKLE